VKRSFSILISGIWVLASGFSFAILDNNTNGLSDIWEKAQNNGHLFSETFDPETDSDSDGWNNAQEAAAGTDPFDPNPPDGLIRPTTEHVPAVIGEENGIPVVITPEAIKIIWSSLAGKQYTLLFSPDLTQGSWLPVEDPFIANGGEVTYNFEINDADKCFWRVAVTDVDTDGDGLTDYEEYQFGTHPASPMTYPAGVYDQTSIPGYVDSNGYTEGWQADTGSHIEIWDEGVSSSSAQQQQSEGGAQASPPPLTPPSPYVELQSHLGAHGVKQEFNMLPGSGLTFILRYKGRYGFDTFDNAFDLKVEGASELLVDGAPTGLTGSSRIRPFMNDDEWNKYGNWHHASVSITAESGGSGLKRITLSLVPQTTTGPGANGEEEITYGGFVDLLPVEVVAVFGFEWQQTGKDRMDNALAAMVDEPTEFKKIGAETSTFYIKGKPRGSNAGEKYWAIQTARSEAAIKSGLASAPYVVFEGHANMGLGPAFNNQPAKISDFTNFGNPQAAINWEYMRTTEYPNFTTITAEETPSPIENYMVLPNKINMLRYENLDGVTNAQNFTLKGSGLGRYHYNRNDNNKNLIVNAGKSDLPALGYQAFFYNSCNTARDFSEVFQHGKFFCSNVSCFPDYGASVAFVEGLIAGETWAEILESLNDTHAGDNRIIGPAYRLVE